MKIFNTKSISFLAITALTSVLLLTSCAKNDDYVEVIGEANIKVVNTVQGSDSQDFYQNDKKLSTAPIAYGESSTYLTIIAGTASSISLKSNISSTVSASNLLAAQVGAKYTLFYYSGLTGGGVISGLQNDIAAPAAGKIKVRFLNLGATLLNTLTLETSAGTSLVNGLAFNFASQYNTIDDNLGVNVKVGGEANVVAIPNSVFQTGKNYTVWFDAANPTTPKYHVVLEN